jgi:hypothetical protein
MGRDRGRSRFAWEMIFVSGTDRPLDTSRLTGEHESGALDPDRGAVR